MDVTNDTVVVDPHVASTADLWKWIVYVGQGGLNFAGNFAIFATVVRHTALRSEKHYAIIAALSFADAFNGLAYAAAGIYRTYLVLFDDISAKVTPWWCMFCVHNLLWSWTDTAAVGMLLVVSVDRLISVVVPLQHLALPFNHTLKLIAIPYGYSALTAVAAFVASYAQPQMAVKPKVCYMSSATGIDYYAVYGMINTLLAFSSIGVYAITGMVLQTIYKKRIAKLLNRETDRSLKQKAIQQRKMTVSLAISCLFTFFLYCVPYGFGNVVMVVAPEFTHTFATYSWIISNFNPMMNMGIYLVRHPEIRLGLKALMINKQMAPHLRSWFPNVVGVSEVTSMRH